MPEKAHVRIDKFLWAVRLYKTRGLASDACRMGRIMINDIAVKPPRLVEENEILTVRKPPISFSYRIIKPAENRQPAKLVPDYLDDLTPENEKARLEVKHFSPSGFRERGSGRPTKKERRKIDRLKEGFNQW